MTETHRENQLGEIIADYLQATQQGQPPNREEMLAAHPELADELRSFFANHDQMRADVGVAFDEATLAHKDERTEAIRPAREIVGYFGDYELLAEIARGGMGVVYRARQVNLDRVVALKMILSGQLASEDEVRRFYQEAEAAANLQHPGIVSIYEIGEHEGQHFFSMAYVYGPSLADLLSDGPLPPLEAAQVVQQVAEATAYAHSQGVIHRDLKPANILLARRNRSRY